MRAPLLALIGSYALAITGLVLLPGQDADGNPAAMGFFHAFYVVAYTGTTIGFGELPHAFTDVQRLWMSLCIFLTVGVWIYAVGTLIALLQDSAFQRALAEGRFRRRIQRLRDPFYLVCGYGQTGGALVWALTDRHQHAVVIDWDPERISLLALEGHREYVPALCGDMLAAPPTWRRRASSIPGVRAWWPLPTSTRPTSRSPSRPSSCTLRSRSSAGPTPMTWRPTWPPSALTTSMTPSTPSP